MTAAVKIQTMINSQISHHPLANAIRFLSMDAVEAAKSGHPGMPMGMADVATVLFSQFLKFDPKNPDWPDRDRFILSAGHGSMLLYSLLYLTGYADMTMDQIKRFRQLGSKTAGHPEYGFAAGIETTTGPLGQGLANAVGFALAERVQCAEFGDDLADHYTYVIAGDGCLEEGISHEACELAGHLKLNKLIVLFDDNGITIDGHTDLSTSIDQLARFKSYGWNAERIDGHNPEQIAAAISRAQKSDRPSLIACKTTIGFGAPKKAGSHDVHGSPLGAEEIAATRENLAWPHKPFEIPQDILNAWRDYGARGAGEFANWQKRLDANTQKSEFLRRISGDVPKTVSDALSQLKAAWVAEKPKIATRQASGKVLEIIQPLLPEMVGGSADLTPSNNTKVKTHKVISAGHYGGNYIHYGIREHAMAAAMNGLALHGGMIPYAGTFLVFTDYARPAIRLSALMHQRVIYIMTHDSIGLGEDGPTHQPVEHYAALRAIPNLLFLRPSDPIETAEAWEIALNRKDGPSVIALTRQAVPFVRFQVSGDRFQENLSAKGAYVLSDNDHAVVTLFASGSEIGVAMAARDLLAAQNIAARVVSVPSMELFAKQPDAHRKNVLGNAKVNVAIEAGIRQGWDQFIGSDGIFIGMTGFGASAPASDLFKHFGITAERVVEEVKKRYSV